ncbi:MAG: methylmalonyl Co-A mutase-associated GTPase MeaB [Ilumatobacteraceae bacterium]
MAAPAASIDALFDAARAGDRPALARLLSTIERGGEGARRVAARATPLAGRAYSVGLTGAPGAGKSTLTSGLVGHLRSGGSRVAVLAIDPTSPFTGGAILGDRVRMQDHALDDGVFIRSMATRGHLGGLSLAAPEAVRLLDAAGWPWVLVETVGVGQVEVEIAGSADTTVVVVNPGWGDAVQASKAGLMEIADVFVINKADRHGVEQTRADLEMMIDLADRAHDGWRPPVVNCVATNGTGIADVWDAVLAHRTAITTSGELDRRRAARRLDTLRRIVMRRLEQRAQDAVGAAWSEIESAVAAGTRDPWSASDDLLAAILPRASD